MPSKRWSNVLLEDDLSRDLIGLCLIDSTVAVETSCSSTDFIDHDCWIDE